MHKHGFQTDVDKRCLMDPKTTLGWRIIYLISFSLLILANTEDNTVFVDNVSKKIHFLTVISWLSVRKHCSMTLHNITNNGFPVKMMELDTVLP